MIDKKRFGHMGARVACLLALIAAPVHAALVINEIDADTPGTDTEEFIEIYETTGTSVSLDGFVVVLFNGNATNDASYLTIDLTGFSTDANGFFVIGSPGMPEADIEISPGGSGWLQNGADAVALYNAPAASFPNGTLPTTSNLVDAIVYGTSDPTDNDLLTALGQTTQYDENQFGNGSTTSIGRLPNGTGSFVAGQIPTPGVANGAAPPVLFPRIALGAVNDSSILIHDIDAGVLDRKICVSGGSPPFSIIVESLPAHGDLFNGAGQINSVPTTVTADLTYVPDMNYSGLDTFEVSAIDSNGTPSSGTVVQEVGVQTVGSAFITEIMHSPSLSVDSRAYEFVEVYNPSGSSVPLTRIDVRVEDVINTTDNLVGASLGSDVAKIIAADVDTLGLSGVSNESLTCEWRMAESDVIRVPVENWEIIRSNPAGAPGEGDPDPCSTTSGDRVLVFGQGDILLDGVDLGVVGSFAGTCRDRSAAVIFGTLLLNSVSNDNVVFWDCVDPAGFNSGLRTGEKTGDFANPLFVDFGEPASPPGLEPSCFGSCCLPDGNCDTTGLTQVQCEAICGVFSSDPNDCGVCNPEPLGKCCLPFGECQDTSECECIVQAGGDWNGNADCDFTPGECPVETPLLVVNELEADQPGTDTLEFIELKGVPGSSLAGWRLELFNGANTNAFPPGAISNYLSVDLCNAPGCIVPSSGFIVVGNFGVPNLTIDICPTPGTSCTNRIQNSDAFNDGVALLFNGFAVQSQSFSYGTGSGFVAAGGQAHGTFLPALGLVDDPFTTLARLPDEGTWKLSCLSTPGEPNADGIGACCAGTNSFDCLDDTSCGSCTSNGFAYLGDASTCGPFSCLPTGACCNTTSFECTPDQTQPECELGDGEFLGSNTDCDAFDACFPRGACCVPSGDCLEQVTEENCTLFGGDWNGKGSTCPDIDGFVSCLAGPQVAFDPGCEPFDLHGPDGDVDLHDFAEFQQDVCASAPTGACCQVDGECVITNQFDCEAFAGDFRGVGVSCPPVPACEPISGDILINEVLVDEDGVDINEFIELFGTPNASLNGLSLIVVDGDTLGSTASQNYRRVNLQLDLDGLQLDGNGYLVIGTGPSVPADVPLESIAVFGANTNGLADELQNGSQTYALVQTADVETDGSFNKLTQASVTAINANAIDTVATLDGGAGDHSYFNAPVVLSLGGGHMAYGHRIPNGVDTNTPGDWEALSPAEFGTVNNPTAPTFGAANQAIVGACCNGITCSQTTFAGCAFTFQGFNVPCDPNPCAGACCTPELGCSITTPESCVSPNSYLGGGTECDPNPCVSCTTIEVAEMETDGTAVCITNVLVNTIYDTINSTNNADFTVQDSVGTNGTTIFGSEVEINDLLVGVNKGDLVEIRGELLTFFETRELVSGPNAQLSLVVLGQGTLVPMDRTVGSLQGAALPSSPINNVLIRLKNVQFAPGNQGQPFAAFVNYTVSDADTAETIVVRINNNNNPPPIVGTTIPSGTVDIVGVVKAFGGAFQVTIFEESDIIPVP